MMKKTIKSKTGFRGVCKNGERGYKAQITIAGKSKNLGTFTTMEQGEQTLAWSLCCWVFSFVLFCFLMQGYAFGGAFCCRKKVVGWQTTCWLTVFCFVLFLFVSCLN